MIPLSLYQRTDNGRKTLFDDPLYYILHDEPNAYMDSFIWRELQMAYLLLWGNAYNYIERDGAGRIISLIPLKPEWIEPKLDGKRKKIYYVVDFGNGNGAEVIEQTNILHFKGLSFDGVKGKSPVRIARESHGVALATQKFGAKFFGNGANLSGLITHPSKLSEPALNNLKKSWQKHEGIDNAQSTPILEEGMKYEKIGIPPDEAQFLETRKFQVTEVARWFNLPTHKLNDLERATFSNMEQQDINFVKYSVMPWAKRMEMEMKRKLINESDKKTHYFEYNLEGLLRGDIKTRAYYYQTMRTIGVLNANEIRELENLNHRTDAGGDSYENPNTTAGGNSTSAISEPSTDMNRSVKCDKCNHEFENLKEDGMGWAECPECKAPINTAKP